MFTQVRTKFIPRFPSRKQPISLSNKLVTLSTNQKDSERDTPSDQSVTTTLCP